MRSMVLAVVASVATGVWADRRVTLECDTLDMDEYRRYAAFAKELGATHLGACAVEPSMWQWDAADNRYDPYPNWSMHRPTIFKFVVPEALKPYLNTEYANRNLARLRARAKVLKEFGLKASFIGQEPAYLPEKAYRDHPNWRGPRCDQCRRARTEYYAPCTDDPEVRALYREGMAMLCREIPLESFDFMCNDSGAGFCWYPHLYAGQNGPTACRDKLYADRIVDFLSLLQAGAADAGLKDLKVNLNRYCSDEILVTVLPKLKKNQAVRNRTAEKATATNIIGFPNPFAEHSYPIWCLPRMVAVVEQMQKAETDPTGDVSLTVRSFDEEDLVRFLRLYWGKKAIGAGSVARAVALREVAATFVGEAKAEELVRIWEDIETCNVSWNWAQTGGHIFLLGTAHQRWLTRPFVCFPEELKPEEKDFYRKYQFQAQEESCADDLIDLQGHRWLAGRAGAFAVNRTFCDTLPILRGAIRVAEGLVPAARDEASARYLKALALKLRLYKAITENAAHAVSFQNYLDEGKARRAVIGSLRDFHGCPSDQDEAGFGRMNMIIRDEVDTVVDIIRLLEEAKAQGVRIIRTAERDEFTSVMNLPPVDRLIGELRKKIEVMENHRRDVTRIYRSNNH